MKYISTRGKVEPISSKEAVVRGIAADGGLFVPKEFPHLDISSIDFDHVTYQELAYEVMSLFLTDFCEEELKNCIAKAYDDKFDNKMIAPLAKVEDYYLLELFHGKTSAFKDMALSILPHLLSTAAKSLGEDKEIVILTATSGDTGKAALEGFKDVEGTKIIVFYPENGVSSIQKKQMITQEGKNTFVVGIKGNFDDAQTGVKKIFTDEEFVNRLASSGYKFSSANSINIGRLIPQVVYYYYAYINLVRMGKIKAGDKINFTVPTGNFGNILAGYYASKMGLPVGKLIIASNDNKVLADFFKTQKYDKNREFILTTSPSMDILISSNFERLMYDVYGAEVTSELMNSLSNSGCYEVQSSPMLERMFAYGVSYTKEVAGTIKEVYDKTGYVCDTHTAVGVGVAKKYRKNTGDDNSMVVVSTASPYKFADTVLEAISGESEKEDGVLVNKLKAISGIRIPEGIEAAISGKVLHDNVVSVENMKSQVAKILGI